MAGSTFRLSRWDQDEPEPPASAEPPSIPGGITVDLAAERAMALTRIQQKHWSEFVRGRATLVLGDAGWNADKATIAATIAERYPRAPESEREELLAVTLEVQQTGRPKRDPAEVKVRPPQPEPKVKRVRDVAPAFEEIEEDLAIEGPPADDVAQTPDEVAVVKKPEPKKVDFRCDKASREKVFAVVDRLQKADPDVTDEQLGQVVLDELGIQLTTNQLVHLRYNRLKRDRVKTTRTKSRHQAPVTNRTVAPPATPAATNGAVRTALEPLATPLSDHLQMTKDAGGWCVSVRMHFPTAERAAEVVHALSGAIAEREERVHV